MTIYLQDTIPLLPPLQAQKLISEGETKTLENGYKYLKIIDEKTEN